MTWELTTNAIFHFIKGYLISFKLRNLAGYKRILRTKVFLQCWFKVNSKSNIDLAVKNLCYHLRKNSHFYNQMTLEINLKIKTNATRRFPVVLHKFEIILLLTHWSFQGLNPANVSDEEMIKYLKNWISLSSQIDTECFSLLLHAPILLAYNAPSNWRLIYPEKTKKWFIFSLINYL